jgi:hypothetical protein
LGSTPKTTAIKGPHNRDFSLMKKNYETTSWMGTIIFLICGFLAIAFETLELAYVILSLSIFCIGLVLSSVAFLKSLELSRHQTVTTGDLFLLSMSFPRRIRIILWGSFSVNLIAGIFFAALSSSTNFAFGILASVYPIGNLNMWAISHGSFTGRENTSIDNERDDYE